MNDMRIQVSCSVYSNGQAQHSSPDQACMGLQQKLYVPLPSLSLRRFYVVEGGLKDFDPMKMIIETTTTFVFVVGRIIIITLLCSKESSKTYNEELII